MPSDPTTRPLRCDDLADDLAAADDGVLAGEARVHVGACLRCQAELANYRRLRRSLQQLADAPVPVDPTLHHDVLLALDRADERRARRV